MNKINRVLCIYSLLCAGKCVDPYQLANEYMVNVRSIYRDLSDIRVFLTDQMVLGKETRNLKYCNDKRRYQLI
mgnify:CR=1 FL=1